MLHLFTCHGCIMHRLAELLLKNLLKKKLECAVDGASSHITMLVANVANSMTDRWTLSHTLTMRGGHVETLVNFRPVV